MNQKREAGSTRDAETVAFLQWALPHLGMRWAGFRNVRGTVRKRLVRRLAELRLEDLRAYRALLESAPRLESAMGEWAALESMCRIPISRMYRDRAIFDRIAREILPERADAATRDGRPTLRIWSACCASGEEPWTIAILWHVDVAPNHPALRLDLVATDVEETMIARAERGCYEGGSLRELPARLRNVAFDRDADGAFRVRDALRDGVGFRREDLRAVMPDGLFDVILCRNSVFTYFDEAAQRTVVAGLVSRLREGGALVVGCHERVPDGDADLRLRAPSIYGRL